MVHMMVTIFNLRSKTATVLHCFQFFQIQELFSQAELQLNKFASLVWQISSPPTCGFVAHFAVATNIWYARIWIPSESLNCFRFLSFNFFGCSSTARIIPLLALLAGQQKIYIILILVLCKDNWVVLIPKEWFNWVALEEKTLKSIKKKCLGNFRYFNDQQTKPWY